MSEEKKRGGARVGAGRKRSVCKTVTFGAEADVVAILDKVEHKAKFINDAIRCYIDVTNRAVVSKD